MNMKKSTATVSKSLNSLFNLPTIDLIDRVSVMISQESQPHNATKDYIRQSSQDGQPRNSKLVTPVAREKIVRWLFEIVDYFDVDRSTVAMAMNYADRFMCARSTKASRKNINSYQLICLACLFLATKTIDTTHIDVDLLVKASRGCYDRREILDAEKEVLIALDWRVCGVTSSCFSYHLLGLLLKVVPVGPSVIGSLIDFTRFQIEFSIAEYDICVLQRPSTVAMAAVLNSMDLLDISPSQRAVYYRVIHSIGLSFSSTKVRETCHELNDVFNRQSEDISSSISALSISFRSSDSAVTPRLSPKISSLLKCEPSPTSVERAPTSLNRIRSRWSLEKAKR